MKNSGKRQDAIVQKQHRQILNAPYIVDIFNVIPVILLILNDQRQAVFANQRLMAFLGLDPSDYESRILGRPPGEIFRCQYVQSGGECGATEFCRYCGASNAINCCFLEGKADCQECRLLRITEQELEALDLLVWTHPFEVEGQRYTLFSVVNISDLKRRRALERIFFHDILNAVSGLNGWLEMMRLGYKAPTPEHLQSLQGISRTVIDEIRAQQDLLYAENNELSLSPEPVRTLSFLRQLIQQYRHHKLAQNRSIQIDWQSEDCRIRTDPTLLGRVMGNLIKNGLEAIEENQTLTLAAHQAAPEQIEFQVQSPSFIPRDLQMQLFNRSFSTKGKDRGLGLYSVRLLTERYLKGSVRCESSPEQGTVFKLFYPLDISTASH